MGIVSRAVMLALLVVGTTQVALAVFRHLMDRDWRTHLLWGLVTLALFAVGRAMMPLDGEGTAATSTANTAGPAAPLEGDAARGPQDDVAEALPDDEDVLVREPRPPTNGPSESLSRPTRPPTETTDVDAAPADGGPQLTGVLRIARRDHWQWPFTTGLLVGLTLAAIGLCLSGWAGAGGGWLTNALPFINFVLGGVLGASLELMLADSHFVTLRLVVASGALALSVLTTILSDMQLREPGEGCLLALLSLILLLLSALNGLSWLGSREPQAPPTGPPASITTPR